MTDKMFLRDEVSKMLLGQPVTAFKIARISRGLSQMELATKSKLSRWIIQVLDCGYRQPTDDEASSLSKVLDMKINKMFPKI